MSDEEVLDGSGVEVDQDGAPPAGKRALVVDDDASIRILVTRLLSRRGFIVDAVADGAEAIENLLGHDYDLITLDLMMPRIDGYGVVKYLTQHRPDLLARVIVMTAAGHSNGEDASSLVAHRIDKPFNVTGFLAAVAECTSGEREAESAAAARISQRERDG